ncbi:uncharacterized protein TrAFT101_008473 [Trichoderma asperellum]|uniref:uncharacterized protein n=1 Tax=Trichoderma asperellum TaxID=101201 RepID=UPI00332160E4|nr:hypothetical protein TrAFT101_008473 [Trichoderma asperellum]
MSGSGFEIAGMVLRAFPLAIHALEICRDTANQVGLFLQIKLEYKRWRDELEYHKLLFTKNLRQLLLPLVLDDDKIGELLLMPGGDCWREKSVAELFEKRLGDSYGLYMQYIQGMGKTMDEINRELAINSEWARKMLDSSKASDSQFKLREFLSRQFHKFKLSSNGVVRKRLFEELQEYNDRLERLLRANDEDMHLLIDRSSRHQSGKIDITICNFWKNAKSVFLALASAWTCQCQQHGAHLLLQHRITSKAEFDITLTGFISSVYECHRVRISEGKDNVLNESIGLLDSVPSRQPNHKQRRPTKSALRIKSAIKTLIGSSKTQTSVTLVHAEKKPVIPTYNKIVNLCASLKMSETPCYGYLEGEECRYHIFDISRYNSDIARSVTLDQLLRGDVPQLLTRSKRYKISLILASTFLQLLDSPWLSAFPKRSDIVFFNNNDGDAAFFRLDQPHISRDFNTSNVASTDSSSENMFNFTEALDHLGIMLLELCFGRIMEDQPWAKEPSAGANDQEKKGLNILAAREWQCHVNEEAGGDYAEAVSWCLGGNRIAPQERWRQEMLRRVIQPLHRCHGYLSNGGIEI